MPEDGDMENNLSATGLTRLQFFKKKQNIQPGKISLIFSSS